MPIQKMMRGTILRKGKNDFYAPPAGQSYRWKHWVTEHDIKVCVVCKTAHGKIYAMDETVDAAPPLHFNCRCEICAMNSVIAGFGTKDGTDGADWFVKLATRVAGLQHPDGFWHASLLDPASYPSPETSCTTFIVYSIAYGINEGLLDKEIYLPVMIKGWNALVSAVEPNGKLGYVQQIGADPKKVTRDMTEVYGVGAFLMAGNEIYKMAR